MNVVSDLGGVVLRWDPSAVIRSAFEDIRERALVAERYPGNLDAATEHGIRTIRFEDAESCRGRLQALGILASTRQL